jgi:alpha-L-arabinofuranosidase
MDCLQFQPVQKCFAQPPFAPTASRRISDAARSPLSDLLSGHVSCPGAPASQQRQLDPHHRQSIGAQSAIRPYLRLSAAIRGYPRQYLTSIFSPNNNPARPSTRLNSHPVRLSFLLFALALSAGAQAPLPVYNDSLVSGFQDWGWATHDYANASLVRSGSKSVAVTINSGYVGLQVYHPDLNSAPYQSVSFWANGGPTGGQRLKIYGLLHIGGSANAGQASFTLPRLPTNSWRQITVPLASIGVANKPNFTGFVIQDTTGASQPTFFLDDIQLDAAPSPSTVQLALNANQPLRSADFRWFAVNTAVWDSNFDTPTTISLLKEMDTRLLRFPGGSLSDEYHWAVNRTGTNTWQWTTSFSKFIHVATNAGAQAIITVNYGTGTTNEAAAWVAYANGSSTNTLPLGTDQFGTSWQTVGYWATLRAASPLAHDDGKNFLRINRAAPLAFKYWEIGNECFGGWETDNNTYPHDAYTYSIRAANYCRFMRAVDPSIDIGVVVTPGEDSSANGYTNHPALNPRTGQTHNGWTPVLLTTLKSLGVTPNFAVHHRYPEYTDKNNPVGSDSDPSLLQSSGAWAVDAADLRQQISDYFGSTGTNIELLCTENNSDAGAQGRQSTSLVNGLYYADSLGQLMKTEFSAFVWWDLRNGTDTGGCFDSTLYGWRTYGDLGMVNGLNTRHPTFYAAKLFQYFAQPGDTILAASSDYPLLAAYAARRANGAVSLLVLNKDTLSSFTAQVGLTGFEPGPVATLRSYGIPQDEAARTNAPASAQDITITNLVSASSTFTYAFPPLSLSLFTLVPSPPALAVVSPAEPGGQFVLQLRGQPNVRYLLQSSTDLRNWTTISTNTLTTTSLNFTNPVPYNPALNFFRALWSW